MEEEITMSRILGVGRLGRRTLARRTASMAVGQDRPAPMITNSQRRTITTHRLLRHSIQLCIHCRQNPAGFWVSRDNSQVVRRPWCLSCCQHLDPARYRVQPFDS